MKTRTSSENTNLKRIALAVCLAGFLIPGIGRTEEPGKQNDFNSNWINSHDRIWIGPEYWANPMEDWRIQNGRVECITAANGRNLHLLTHQLTPQTYEFEMSVDAGLLEGSEGAVGFEIGIGDGVTDYRGATVWGSGIKALVKTDGLMKIGSSSGRLQKQPDFKALSLILKSGKSGMGIELSLSVQTKSGDILGSLVHQVDAEKLKGNIALIHNPAEAFMQNPDNRENRRRPKQGNARFWFQNWSIKNHSIVEQKDHEFGPILWAMHSISDNRNHEGYVMKMTALLPPVGLKDSRTVRLQTLQNGSWNTIAEESIHPDSFTATFRRNHWHADLSGKYRLAYRMEGKDGKEIDSYYYGTIRQQPLDRPLVLAGLTCQFHSGFPYQPVTDNLAKVDPDMMFFSGDQLYENSGGFGIIREPADRAILNYLRKYYMFGWAFRDLMRDRPTLCIPDDHDVFQGNIWGEGGMKMVRKGNTSFSGGYREPVRMVEVVHRTNTAHHPDFHDPTPIKQNMSVYYGDMVYGRVSFAILGDRQFKSSPGHVDTGEGRADHVLDPEFDVQSLDKPGLELLGSRQEDFLKTWVSDWRQADMKLLLSETVLANAATHHGRKDGFLQADLDSGGWPQTARNRTLRILRKGFPLHINGDQHLSTLIQYGVDEQRDAGWSFCTPAVSTGYQRWWRPDELGRSHRNRPAHDIPNTGEYLDGFGNRVFVQAVGNPEGSSDPNRYRQAHLKASGFGIVRIDRGKRTYTCESYRFLADLDAPATGNQFAGFPHTIKQMENYGRTAEAWLPEFRFEGITDPVMSIYKEATGELVYSLRVKGSSFQPHVFSEGSYEVRVGEPGERIQVYRELTAVKERKGSGIQTVNLHP